MELLCVMLFVAGASLLAMGALRVRGWMAYNRRRRRRRRKPVKLDLLTRILFVLAVLCLAGGVLTMGGGADSGDPTEPPSETTGSRAGWQEENGVRFYLNADGTHALGWLDLEGQRYYIGGDGAMRTGWLELDGVTYYFKEDGAMARGETVIDGRSRFFTASGAYLPLVNPWHPVDASDAPELVEIDDYYATEGLQIDRSCLADLMAMIDDCNASGSRAYVLSAYRSLETQQRLFDRKVDNLMAQGMSRADAQEKAATVVAVPGTSEHHLGLAVDIIDTRLWDLVQEQEDMPAQKWLMENSWRYGFIFRYPKDKTEVTGIIYEPWHYRYVGRALAAELHESGLTLEEYMANIS